MPLSFQTKQTFRSQPEQIIEDFDLNGGFIADVHETKLAKNQSPNPTNVIHHTTKNLKTRGGYLRYNGDPVGATSDEANTGTSTGTLTIDSIDDYVAQTFQVGSDADFIQVDFYLEMSDSADTQYMTAELWSGDTGPDAKLLQGQTLLVSGASETEYSFRFRVPYGLTSSTEYAVVLRPEIVQTTNETVNSVLVHHTGDDYASGGAYTSSNAGSSWSAVTDTDLKFNVYTGGSTGSTGNIRFYGDNSVQQTIAKFGTAYYRGNDVSGAMTAITLGNGLTPSVDYVDYTVSNGTLLVVDNSNYILKYRGSTNAAYTTGTISVTNGSAVVTGSGTSWATSTNAEVGEYIQLPDQKWYKITAVGSNTSITVEALYYGSSTSGQSYIISPWGVVQGRLNSGGSSPTSESVSSLVRPQPAYIENHINRIWTLVGNSLRFSVLDTSITGEHFNDWDTGGNAGQIIIPSGDGDTGTGLYSLGNSLYIFQRRAIWRLYGSSPANFELRNVTNEVGMISKMTLVEKDDMLTFLSDNGVYLFDGSNLRNISEKRIHTFIDSWANKTSPSAVLWGNRYLISYTSAGGTSNDGAIFYDYDADTWWKIDGVYASVFSAWNGGSNDGEIYFASSNQGTLYRWDVGTHDDGYAITTTYETASLSFGSGMNDKALKRFYVQQLALGDWDETVTMFSNISEATTTATPINLSPGNASLWDVMEWDTNNWSGEGAIITTRLAEFQGQGRYFRFRFVQTGYGEGYEILGLTGTARQRRLN